MKNLVIAGAVALAVSVAPAYAQTPRPADQKPADQKAAAKNADEHFVMDAAHAGMAEVELGKMATEKASKDEVKKFGQRMVDDHSKAGDELKSIAQTKNIAWPTDLDAKHKAVRDRLMKLSGDAFDRAYMQEMVDGHRKVVAALRTESTSGKDPEIKAWAAKTLPTTQDHLKQAQDIARGVVGTTGTAKPKP
jgi:putative membrane protein